jgi:hypothetical protein
VVVELSEEFLTEPDATYGYDLALLFRRELGEFSIV